MFTRSKKTRFCLIILLLSLFGFIVQNYLSNYKPANVVSGNLSDSNFVQQISEEDLNKYAQEKVDSSKVVLDIYPELNLMEDGEVGSFFIRDLPSNKLGQEALLKDGDGKEIFDSGLIKPGEEIKRIKLKRKVNNCIGSAIVKFIDLKNRKEVGQTSVKIKINVKSQVKSNFQRK